MPNPNSNPNSGPSVEQKIYPQLTLSDNTYGVAFIPGHLPGVDFEEWRADIGTYFRVSSFCVSTKDGIATVSAALQAVQPDNYNETGNFFPVTSSSRIIATTNGNLPVSSVHGINFLMPPGWRLICYAPVASVEFRVDVTLDVLGPRP